MIHAPQGEVLRYLGYGKHQPEGESAALIDGRVAAVEQAADPRWTVVELPLTLSPDGVTLGDWTIQSQKLRAHLEGCTSALLFGATLGIGVDRLIARSAAGKVAQAAVDQAAAAALIEACGLKGVGIGGAQVSEKHAGFVINRGDATADDVRRLMALVQETVLRETGVALEPEVRLLGF